MDKRGKGATIHPKADIRSRRTVFKGRYRIEEVVFDFDRVAGHGRIEGARREVFDRGDSVAGLLHDIERDVVIVTQQFRVATHDKGPGYLIEAMAGSVEEGEDPEDCLRREMMEEVGYRAGALTRVATAYASPGSSSERIFLYYVPVRAVDLVDPDASGLMEEGEDVRRVEFSREDFLARLEAGEFEDAKLLTLGYWLRSQPRKGRPLRRG